LDAGAELLVFETIPDLLEAKAICTALAQLPKGTEAFVSFTCREDADGNLVSDNGAAVDACIAAAAESTAVVAVGFNCVEPRLSSRLLTIARSVSPKPLIWYPNSGEVYYSAGQSGDGRRDWQPPTVGKVTTPLEFGAMAMDWHANGAQLIGGCCRIGPLEIAALAATFREV
jgi:homocysteine S-methyltransferase